MWRDDAYLLDMLLAAHKIRKYTKGFDFAGFEQHEVTQDAVMRHIQIIGEAARKVFPEFKASHPEIPWSEIIGMRHLLVHEYFRIIPEKVWETATKRYSRINFGHRTSGASGKPIMTNF